ncbi:MAG: outer membrane beta-barrel protein [Salinivirgaceae bacterium]|nr:outer membrane beta-barrel protein [Salinivirgaceae bacterium]MDD4746020.1 outer membrane beta-barrel protein [Salinivirgaceae bacterium]
MRGVYGFLALVLMSSSLLGQNKNMAYGIDFSPTINWISSSIKDVKNDGARVGMSYGLSVISIKNENFGIVSGVRMNHSSYDVKYNQLFDFETYDSLYSAIPSGTKVRYKLQQIELPVGFSLRSRQIGYTTITAETGLNVAYTLGTKVSIDDLGVENETAKNEVTMFNVGYFFGGGIIYSLGGSTAIKTMIVFSNGLTDLTNDRNHKEDQTHSYRLGLTLGLIF